jgi:protoheme IX farnesyltransferase
MNSSSSSEGVFAADRSRAYDYLALTKPELTLLSVFTAVGGAFLASSDRVSYVSLIAVFFGTAFVGGACGVLNQYLECSYDAQMNRTKQRPLPSGRISASEALILGICLAVLGVGVLALWTSFLAAGFSVLTLVTYLFLYTPLKRHTPFATILGGIPGALPPLIGWTAVTGTLSMESWALFFILFFWQMPHFLALGWMYRADYARAGFRLLSVVDETGTVTSRQAMIYAIALLPASVMPTLVGLCGVWYFVGAAISSLVFLLIAFRFVREHSNQSARRLFVASLVYLPTVLFLLLVDRLQ